MCDTAREREISKKIFQSAKTVVDFMNIWSKFYENKICIPTYYSKFVGAEDSDASVELGLKLKEIAQRGVLGIDSQVGEPGQQKQYIIGFMPTKMANMVIEELNRYSGIVAFYSDIKEEVTTNGLFVTYDPESDEDIIKGSEEKKMLGDPFSIISGPDEDSFESIRKWMSDKVKKKINKKTYSHFAIIAPCFTAPPEYIFDKLLEVLRGI